MQTVKMLAKIISWTLIANGIFAITTAAPTWLEQIVCIAIVLAIPVAVIRFALYLLKNGK